VWRYERGAEHGLGSASRRHRGRARRRARAAPTVGRRRRQLIRHPLPGKVRQARFVLPHGVDWKGLGLTAELEVKGVRRPVRWACRQRLEDDGTLTLRPTVGLGGVL
jgi:hypothetical protein